MSVTQMRLDAMQALMQSIALSQNQHSRMIAEIQTTLAEHGRRFDRLDAGITTITAMLTTLIGQGEPGGDDGRS